MKAGSASSARPEFLWVPTELLVPNDWNPNEMDQEQYRRAVQSIRDFGFVSPIVVRHHTDGVRLQIIDGENRWRAAKDEQLFEVPVSLKDFTDAEAQQLTIILNEVRGTPNPQKLGEVLRRLSAVETKETLLARLPFSREALDRLTGLPSMGFEGLTPSRPQMPIERPSAWVERVYRMPQDAAERIDEVIRRWREAEDSDVHQTPDWRVLELVCADWLSGA